MDYFAGKRKEERKEGRERKKETAPYPAKWKVFRVIWVEGSPIDWPATIPTASPGSAWDWRYLRYISALNFPSLIFLSFLPSSSGAIKLSGFFLIYYLFSWVGLFDDALASLILFDENLTSSSSAWNFSETAPMYRVGLSWEMIGSISGFFLNFFISFGAWW